ncbi:hypothetical protein BJ138DRAFT_531126 [Hygrophoropsis aurantiaca]|uniref:Uncharacterized protein n=1 Tax=Hygrophoropsis aurantiaca TaxID=72124 RepID=A0ACB8A1Y5_9AGAM|nr:hypothetical protein BJ138DRAFT_531126 [Hygrophoropsis aurantiaca]
MVICQCVTMPQYIDTEISYTQPDTRIETEADRSSSSGLSIYASEGLRHIRMTPKKQARAHGVTNIHYPRQTDISTVRSATRTGIADDTTPSTSQDGSILNDPLVPLFSLNPLLSSILDPPSQNATLPGSISFQTVTPNSTIWLKTSYLSTLPSSDTVTGAFTIPQTTSVASTTGTIIRTSTLSSPQGQMTSRSNPMTSGSNPMTFRSHTPPLGIIAGSAAGGTAVLLAVIFTALCIVRRRARRRNRYNDNRRAYNHNDIRSDSNSNRSSPADLESRHEHEAPAIIPVDHDGKITSTATAPALAAEVSLSTTAVVSSVPVLSTSPHRSTILPTSSPGVPVPTTSTNSCPSAYQDAYQYLDRDPYPRSDCCSEHELDIPCPSYSCISLSENNFIIGSTTHDRNGRGRRVEGGDGDEQGRTRGRWGSRSRSRSASRPTVRRTNVPSRSTARATFGSSLGRFPRSFR